MSMSREELTFASSSDRCAAWFYPAAADKGARPIIVMAHGLTGTRRDRLGAFAERFAAAGIAALVFDYRGFGDSASIRVSIISTSMTGRPTRRWSPMRSNFFTAIFWAEASAEQLKQRRSCREFIYPR